MHTSAGGVRGSLLLPAGVREQSGEDILEPGEYELTSLAGSDHMDETNYEVNHIGDDPAPTRPTVKVDVRARQAILEEPTGLTSVIRRHQPVMSWMQRVRSWFSRN